jgi:hypothetical protein
VIVAVVVVPLVRIEVRVVRVTVISRITRESHVEPLIEYPLRNSNAGGTEACSKVVRFHRSH